MSAKISTRQIAAAVLELLDLGRSLATVAESVAYYLIEQRRSKDIDGLLRDLLSLRAERGQVEATASSAFALEPAVRAQLEKLLTEQYPGNPSIAINQVNDPAAIGGVRVDAPDVQLDLTIAHRLQQLTLAPSA